MRKKRGRQSPLLTKENKWAALAFDPHHVVECVRRRRSPSDSLVYY